MAQTVILIKYKFTILIINIDKLKSQVCGVSLYVNDTIDLWTGLIQMSQALWLNQSVELPTASITHDNNWSVWFISKQPTYTNFFFLICIIKSICSHINAI